MVTVLLEHLNLVHLQYWSGSFLHNLYHKSSNNALIHEFMSNCIICDHINFSKTKAHYNLQHNHYQVKSNSEKGGLLQSPKPPRIHPWTDGTEGGSFQAKYMSSWKQLNCYYAAKLRQMCYCCLICKTHNQHKCITCFNSGSVDGCTAPSSFQTVNGFTLIRQSVKYSNWVVTKPL